MQSFHGAAILFAVEREEKPFLKFFRDRRPFAGGWLCDADRLLVARVGVGPVMAARWVERFARDGHHPSRLMIAGFAGALVPGRAVGDVVVVDEVLDFQGNRWKTDWPMGCAGRLLTSDRMIGDPAEKAALGKHFGATLVDMESAILAEACRARGIPFGCARVVSDDINRPLSRRLMTMMESGRVSIPRIVGQLLRSPRLLPELLRLAKETRFAARRLAHALFEITRSAP
jgi:adenosylhomocysteine nucleosidase